MSKVLTSLPVGERVGIAFSGGLDTSVAVAWMRDKGAIPCTYTADIGQYDEPDIESVPGRATQYGAELSRLVDCKAALVDEGLAALACGAFHIRSGGRQYFNTTPLGRAVTGTLLVRAMHDDGVSIWGDGSTFKGNDIERFYRYGLLANPSLRIYKPWLDADFVEELGGRKEMSEWLAAHDLPYRDSVEKAYSTDANIWGATHEAKTLEHLDTSIEIVAADHGRAVLGSRGRRSRPRTSRSASHRVVRSRSTARASTPPSPSCTRPTRSADATDWAWPTRSRTASSRPRAAASTRRRAWPCCSSRTSGCSARSTTRTRSRTTTQRAAAWVACCTRAAGWIPQALMLRESLQRWVASAVTGEVTVRLRRGDDYSIIDTRGPAFSYHPDKLSMERTEDAAFGPVDRIGQLTMRNLDIADSRAKLELYAAQGTLLAGQARLVGELEPGGAAAIAAAPAEALLEEDEAETPRPRGDGVRHRLTPADRLPARDQQRRPRRSPAPSTCRTEAPARGEPEADVPVIAGSVRLRRCVGDARQAHITSCDRAADRRRGSPPTGARRYPAAVDALRQAVLPSAPTWPNQFVAEPSRRA